MEYICRFCGKICKNANSLRNHERLCKSNPDHQESPWIKFNKKRGAWNKGLTKESDERVRKQGKTFSNRYKGTEIGMHIFSHPHTEDFKRKMHDIAIQRQLGGWHTSKTIEYKGIKLDSRYELAVVEDLDKNKIKWERPHHFVWKDETGNIHRYYPDFYLPEYDVYLDPKNDFLINNKSKRFGITDIEKIQKVSTQNNIKILILDKNHLNWESIKELL